MKHTLALIAILLLAPRASLLAADTPKPTPKPNVVFIFAATTNFLFLFTLPTH